MRCIVALVGQGSRSHAHTGGSFAGTGERSCEGRRRLCNSLQDRTREVEWLCWCWRWLGPGAAGPGEGEGAQMVGHLSARKHSLLHQDWGAQHSCADFPVPRIPWGSFWEEGVMSQPTPDPTWDPFLPRGAPSFLTLPWRGVCAHVQNTGQMWC